MRIPKKVRIVGRDFRVKRDHEGLLHEGCYGIIDYDENLIRLREGKPYFSEHQEAQTFLHEIIHAVDYSFGIHIDEEQTTRLAVGLLAVIRDNKLDFRALEEKENELGKLK